MMQGLGLDILNNGGTNTYKDSTIAADSSNMKSDY